MIALFLWYFSSKVHRLLSKGWYRDRDSWWFWVDWADDV